MLTQPTPRFKNAWSRCSNTRPNQAGIAEMKANMLLIPGMIRKCWYTAQTLNVVDMPEGYDPHTFYLHGVYVIESQRFSFEITNKRDRFTPGRHHYQICGFGNNRCSIDIEGFIAEKMIEIAEWE